MQHGECPLTLLTTQPEISSWGYKDDDNEYVGNEWADLLDLDAVEVMVMIGTARKVAMRSMPT